MKPREYYEDIYDRQTVEGARRDIVHYWKFYEEFEKKLPKDDQIERPGNALLLNVFYMETVGNRLLNRYEQREQHVNDWMARDEAKDAQLAAAGLTEEPYCHHCGKLGLRIIDKHLMHRKPGARFDDPEEVLIMLECTHCQKTSAFWEDGTAWKPKPTLCPKCKVEMTHKATRSKQAINTTYTCPSCKHRYKDRIDLSDKKEKPDPDFDKDRITYCLLDKEFRDKLFEIRRGLNEFARMGKEFKEKEDNKPLYDAANQLEKLKIVELQDKLRPVIEEAGYKEVRFAEPEIGREFVVGISCLDGDSKRDDYTSRQTLKKTIDKALEKTNWRLMSTGVEYRLGYLSGKLRAYESEEDLLKLVEKNQKRKSGANDTTKA